MVALRSSKQCLHADHDGRQASWETCPDHHSACSLTDTCWAQKARKGQRWWTMDGSSRAHAVAGEARQGKARRSCKEGRRYESGRVSVSAQDTDRLDTLLSASVSWSRTLFSPLLVHLSNRQRRSSCLLVSPRHGTSLAQLLSPCSWSGQLLIWATGTLLVVRAGAPCAVLLAAWLPPALPPALPPVPRR